MINFVIEFKILLDETQFYILKHSIENVTSSCIGIVTLVDLAELLVFLNSTLDLLQLNLVTLRQVGSVGVI